MDSELTLISHQPFCSSCRRLLLFFFFNLHVLTQIYVTGCYGGGGAGFMTGEVYLWEGGWGLMAHSMEPTLKASSFLNDVKQLMMQ